MEENNTRNNDAQQPVLSQQTESKSHGEQNTLMAVLCYVGPLVLVPLMTTKEDPFVKFHIKQGLVLVIIAVAAWIIHGVFWLPGLYLFMNLINLVVLILSIIGIMNALKHKEEGLPVVGKFASHLNF